MNYWGLVLELLTALSPTSYKLFSDFYNRKKSMRTRRAKASSPNSDPQYFWNEYLQKWTDLRANCIAEAQLPLCRDKPSAVNLKSERITRLNIDLRADLLKRWTEQEKELFTQRFIEVGKDFPLIADALPNKTVSQCIQYYYLTKHRFCYKKLRQKAIDEGDGIRSRRAKSCGNGKESQIFSQRLGKGERNAKGKLRKNYSCPEPIILKSKETLGNIKSRRNDGIHSTEDPGEPNATRSQSGDRKGPSKDLSIGIETNGVNTRQRKLSKEISGRNGSTMSITALDHEEKHNNDYSVKRAKKRTRTWEDLNDDECCSASKRKSLVKEPRNQEHKYSYDGSKDTTLKRKRPKADAQTKVSKKLRKSDIAGLFSGHDNTLSQPGHDNTLSQPDDEGEGGAV